MSNHTKLFKIEKEIEHLENQESTPEIERRIAELDEEANMIQCVINKHTEEIKRLERAKQAAHEQREIERKRKETIRIGEYQDRVKAFYSQHCTTKKMTLLLEEFGHEFEGDYELIGTTVKSHVAKDHQNNIHFCSTEEKALHTMQRLIYWRIRHKLLHYVSLDDILRIEDILDRIESN